MLPVHSNSSCAVCDTRMTVHQQAAGDTCDNPRCRLEHLKRGVRADAEKQERIRASLVAEKNRAAARQGLRDPATPVAAIPSNDRDVVALDRSRRDEFRAYLEQSAAEAAAAIAAGEALPERPSGHNDTGLSAGEQATMLEACAVCRGSCCADGRTHAFLQPEHLQRRLQEDPESSAEELVEHYMGKLPAASYADSCVYHTASGCTLEREDRARPCNEFLCRGLADLWQGMSAARTTRAFVGAVVNERVLRTAFIGEDALGPEADSGDDREPD